MKENYWDILKSFISERITEPIKHPSFVMYFFIIIVMVGSIGIYDIIIMSIKNRDFDIESFVSNASNIFLALIAGSAVELILINEEDLKHPYRKNDIRILGTVFLIIGFLFWMFSKSFIDQWFGLVASIIGLIFGFVVWWISNAGNPNLITPKDSTIPIGGSDASRQELPGSVDGFKS
jgi:hypothetical protein